MSLTQKDLKQIEQIVDKTVGGKLEEKVKNLPTRDEFEQLGAQVKNLPTRDEFFTAMSELMGEVQAAREENTILNGRTSDHEDRITALEEIHPSGKHI